MSESKSFHLDLSQRGQLIDGTAIAQAIRNELKAQVDELQAKLGKSPKLAVILVGERKDSQTYVRMKTKACEEVGIGSVQLNLPITVTQEELLTHIKTLNQDESVNGILVQLPLPSHLSEEIAIAALSPEKDADGLHTVNMGKLTQSGHHSLIQPCTPKGCIELLDRSGVSIEGKQAVVLGRSNLVGKPVALLLMSRNATVTMCHSKTSNLEEHIKRADIIICAMGRPKSVKGEWIKDGAVVIDVSTCPIDDPTKKAGYRLVGDVDFEVAKPRCAAITPVPGGVGPMTVAMLLANTITNFKRANL